MATLVYRTIGSASSLGPLVTATGIDSYVVNQAVAQAEAGQPEGMRIQLLVPNLGQFAQPAANALQSRFLTGQFKDPATGTPIIPWPETPSTVADIPIGQPGTLRVRWVKGQWQIEVVIGIAVAIIGYLLIQSLHGSPWSMQSAAAASSGGTGTTTPMFGGQPFRVFYVPWYWAAAGTLGLVAAPFVLHKVAQTEGSEAELVQNRRALRQAEEG